MGPYHLLDTDEFIRVLHLNVLGTMLSVKHSVPHLVAAGGDNGGFVSVWNMADGKLLTQDVAPMHVHDFELSLDGRYLIAVGHQQGAVINLFSVSG